MSGKADQAGRTSHPAPASNGAHADPASRVSDAVLAYVPRALLESLARNPERSVPWHERIEGTLLMGDVSGFTAMSELLAKAGKEGAEWLTDIINSFFGHMLGIAAEYSGDTVTFGGDAVLLLFQGNGHGQRACAAARAMLDATAKLPAYKVGTHRVRLGMSMGAHSGEFFFGSAGLEGFRLQCLIFGPGAAQTCRAEAAASSGELFVTPETAGALGDGASVEPRDAFYLVTAVPQGEVRGLARDVDLLAIASRLAPYLPPAVAAALAPGAPEHEPESDHRKVCVAFVNIMGVDELLATDGPEAVLRDLQSYVAATVRLSERYGGYLVSNDVYTLGLKLIVTFGAPVAHEHDTANALRMASDLRDEAVGMGLRLSHRIGVNSGFVFAGDVGPSYRRQYTVMGDAVNLAARLMSAASAGEAYVSLATLEEAGSGFDAPQLPPISVKGKKDPVPVCALAGECHPGEAPGEVGELVGRDEELRALTRAVRDVESGRSKVAVVRGEAGIGKSSLAQALRRQLEERSWEVLAGGGQPHTTEQPFALWTAPLMGFLGIDVGDDARSRAARIVETVQRLKPASLPWVPLLGPLLGADLPATDAVRALKESDRRERLFLLVAELLRARTARTPVALVMEDLHWADASSLTLLERVVAETRSSALLVVATARPESRLPAGLTSDALIIDLKELSAAAAGRIVSDVLGRDDLPEALAHVLLDKTRGNPLFIQEVARSLAASGKLDGLIASSGFELAARMAALEIPDRVQGLVMARVDALPERTKDVLRTAAVIGTTFERSTLAGVLETARDDLDDELAALTIGSLTDPDPSAAEPTFRFRHALIQEVAYESLKFSKRRDLHRRIAAHIERAHARDLEQVYESLVRHYSAGRDDAKTRVYSVKAAGKARRLFAHDEAVAYYRVGLKTVRARTPEATTLRSLIEEKVGDTYETAGRPTEAARAYLDSLARWRRASGHVVDGRIAPPAIAELAEGFAPEAQDAALCHKIGFSYGRTYSDYDLALQWLAMAREVLPRGHPLLEAKIAVAESNAWFRKGDYGRAIERGRRGLQIARRTRSLDVRAYALTILANSYYELGRLSLAIRQDTRALRLYEELEDLSGQAMTQANIGASFSIRGPIDASLEHTRAALAMFIRIGNAKEIALANTNIGEDYVIRGDFELAVEHLQGVLEECSRMPSALFLEGTACLDLARAYQGLHRYDKAESAVRRASSLLERAGTPSKSIEALVVRASLELETDRIAEARRTCEQALEAAREMGHRELQCRANRVLAGIACACGNRARAEELLRASIAEAEQIGAPYERGLGLLALAELYATWNGGAGNARPLRRTLRQAIGVLDAFGDRAALARARQLEALVPAAPSSSRGSV